MVLKPSAQVGQLFFSQGFFVVGASLEKPGQSGQVWGTPCTSIKERKEPSQKKEMATMHRLYLLISWIFNSNAIYTGKEKSSPEGTIEESRCGRIVLDDCFLRFDTNVGKQVLKTFGNTRFQTIKVYCGH